MIAAGGGEEDEAVIYISPPSARIQLYTSRVNSSHMKHTRGLCDSQHVITLNDSGTCDFQI